MVLSRDQGRASQFAKQYGASCATTDEDVLLGAQRPDVVYIASPHIFHLAQARSCLQAGIPVLCEKPLTVNARGAAELVRLSRENRVFLMEAIWTRYLPVSVQVRQWLQEGRIGRVEHMSSTFGFRFPRNPSDRVLNPHLAGGALLDIGIYNLTVSQWVFGSSPDSFAMESLLGETGVDEVLSGTLRYGKDRFSMFSCSIRTRLENSCHLSGAAGQIHINPPFWGSEGAQLITGQDTTKVSLPFECNGFEYEIREVHRCLNRGLLESPDMSLGDTVATLKLMDELRKGVGLRYPFEMDPGTPA